MAFDPDEFLKKTDHLDGHGPVTRDKSVTGFDPDAFLADTQHLDAPQVGKAESALRGAAQGLSMGFADEITGGLEHLIRGKDYKQARDESRAAYHAAEGANPKTYMAGQGVGSVAPLLVPGVGEIGAAKLMAQGAVQGIGDSEADTLPGLARDAGIGAATQGVFHGAGKVAGSVLSKAAPALESLSGYTGAKAAGFTKGLRKKYGVDETNKLGRWLVDKGIITAGADTSDMLARTEAMKKTAGDRIGEIIKDLDTSKVGTPDAGRILDSLSLKMKEVEGVAAARPVARQYQTAISDIQRFKRAPSYEGLQRLKKTYGDIAFPKGVVTEAKPGIVDAYHAIKDELNRSVDQGVQSLKRPDIADIYRNSKTEYGNTKLALKGLEEKQASEQGNRWVKPTDFLVGVPGLALGSVPGTLAALAAKRAAETYGPQTVAVTAAKFAPTAAKIADLARTAPQRLGRFAPAITTAAQRGPAAVASTHFILMQQQPEYRQLINDTDQDEQ